MIRIAGNLHGMEHAAAGTLATPISAETMRAAIQIGLYLKEHAKAAFHEMGADPAIGLARRILKWINDSDIRQFTKRDLFNHLKNSIKRVDVLDDPIRLLSQHGYIRERVVDRQPGKAGRPASPIYEVNPLRAISAQSAELPVGGYSADSADCAPGISGNETVVPATPPTTSDVDTTPSKQGGQVDETPADGPVVGGSVNVNAVNAPSNLFPESEDAEWRV